MAYPRLSPESLDDGLRIFKHTFSRVPAIWGIAESVTVGPELTTLLQHLGTFLGRDPSILVITRSQILASTYKQDQILICE